MNLLTRIHELDSEQRTLRPEIERLANIEHISAGDNERLNNLLTRYERNEASLTGLRMERARQLADIGTQTVSRENGDGATMRDAFNVNRGGFEPWDDSQLSRFGTLDGYGRPGADNVRNRALAAVESIDFTGRDIVDVDATRELATRVIEEFSRKGDTSAAEWAHAVSDPAYLTAFRKMSKHPQHYSVMLTDAERHAFARTLGGNVARMHGDNMERATLSLSGASALLPLSLDPTVILTNAGSANPFRQIARVVQTTQNVHHVVSSAGVTAEWIAESTQVADATPTFSGPTITCYKADAYVQLSLEAWQDSSVDDEIARLIQDARDNLEATAHATGNGSTQPQGIVTALDLVTASRVAGTSGAAGAADFVLADIYALDNALDQRWTPDSAWVCHKVIANKIRRFGEGTTGSNSAFWADLGRDVPPLLLGRPLYQSSAMDSTIVSGSSDNILILGDFRRGYYIADRIGMSIQFNPLVMGANNRPLGDVAWVAFWRTGAAEVTGGAAFRMLRV